jgi:hypothetical protein
VIYSHYYYTNVALNNADSAFSFPECIPRVKRGMNTHKKLIYDHMYGRGVKLTTHFHLVPKDEVKNAGAIPPIPLIYS